MLLLPKNFTLAFSAPISCAVSPRTLHLPGDKFNSNRLLTPTLDSAISLG
jgi:hypothetical protein